MVVLGFTRFYWVSLDFTRFYWVLLGFTGRWNPITRYLPVGQISRVLDIEGRSKYKEKKQMNLNEKGKPGNSMNTWWKEMISNSIFDRVFVEERQVFLNERLSFIFNSLRWWLLFSWRRRRRRFIATNSFLAIVSRKRKKNEKKRKENDRFFSFARLPFVL